MESGIVKRNFKKSCTFRQKAEKQRKYVRKWAEKSKKSDRKPFGFRSDL